jgi:hypothetical protein
LPIDKGAILIIISVCNAMHRRATMPERRMMVRMADKLHKAARLKAVSVGKPLSEIVRDLLAGWVAGDIALPQPTEAQPESPKPKREKP